MARLSVVLLLSLTAIKSHQQSQPNKTEGIAEALTSYCIPDVTLPRSCKGRAAADIPSEQSSAIESEVSFIIYTPKYEPDAKPLVTGDIKSLKESGYDKYAQTKIIIHGYFSSAKYFEHTVFAYLKAADHNVILMDWSGVAKWCYCEHVIKKIDSIGKVLGKLLDFLVEQGTDLKDIHLIGHSLGAHVAGIASVNCQRGRVGRISALDPARPGFSEGRSNSRLDKSRAAYVDVIHTSAHSFGIAEPLGHADFYPNGGQSPQPGCSGATADICSHSRSHYLFTESIITDVGYQGVSCPNWYIFLNGTCNARNAPTVTMGERIDKSKEGIFYLKTGATCPYFVTAPSNAVSAKTYASVISITLILLSLIN